MRSDFSLENRENKGFIYVGLLYRVKGVKSQTNEAGITTEGLPGKRW